jgi:hypothetical protein
MEFEMSSRAERDAELAFERIQLAKADLDIEQGRYRYSNQQSLLDAMRANGFDTRQAERLVDLLGETLVEWENHRDLINARIAHLEGLNRTSILD